MVVSNILEFILFIETMKEVPIEIFAFGKIFSYYTTYHTISVKNSYCADHVCKHPVQTLFLNLEVNLKNNSYKKINSLILKTIFHRRCLLRRF